MSKRVLIIGGVAVGMKVASRLRRVDPKAKILVLERGFQVSYGACGFPYYIGEDVKDFTAFTHTPQGVLRGPEFFEEVKGFDILLRREVLSINRDEKAVVAYDLEREVEEYIPYDILVLATGATPIKLPVSGNELRGIYNFWFPWEVLQVEEEIKALNVKEVAIVGAGLIGMELAEAFHKKGIKVKVVEMKDRILPQMLDKELGDHLKKSLTKKGIEFHLGEVVSAFEGTDKVSGVRTNKGVISAQLVIVAVGVKPNVELAEKAGLKIGETGAIVVDKYLRTSDSTIYAGGDCVENNHLVGSWKVYAPMGSTANKHGRVIANNIAGQREIYPGVLTTSICQIMDWQVGSTGLNETTAAAQGFKFTTVVVPGSDRLGYMPGAKPIILKLIAEEGSHRILGAQAIGMGGVDKRIDAIATVINYHGILEDLSNMDYGYAPPFNGPIDNIATAANVLLNKMNGMLKGINPKDFQKYKTDPRYTLVDVRTPGEFAANRIAGCGNIINLPLNQVRSTAEESLLDKNAYLVTSCQINLRGYEAAVMLKGLGYKNVYSLEGGMSAWPYETESDKDKK